MIFICVSGKTSDDAERHFYFCGRHCNDDSESFLQSLKLLEKNYPIDAYEINKPTA
jgi:hypothetical protein